MKRRILIPTMILAFVSFASNAQTITTKENRTVVTKGYYFIGNNSEKLASAETIKTVALPAQPVAQKGYYSVESNRRKLPASQGINLSERKTIPVRKGYYGIGDNDQKLK
jgi:hypothetical protein